MHSLTKKICLTYTILATIALSATVTHAEDATPWWFLPYEADQNMETTYEYDADGVPMQNNTINGNLTFLPVAKSEFESTDFTAIEQRILAYIENQKTGTQPEQDEIIFDNLLKQFGDTQQGTILDMMGYYEYKTATGYYAYLNEKPSGKEIAIYDAWYMQYATTYPNEPKTLQELTQITQEVLSCVAEKFKVSTEEVSDIAHKMERYQDKYKLPKHIPLSESLMTK